MSARSAAVAALAVLLLTAAAACQPSAPRSGPLRVAMASEVSGLDPHRQNAHGGLSVASNVYEALTAFDSEMRVVPGLAVRWESPDELTWLFHLRPGVLFHDGRPLTSADVVKSLERARRPGSSAAGGLSVVRDVAAMGPDVVAVHTLRANPMLLNNLATAFVTPADAPDTITTPIGTGPYRFVRFDPGLLLELHSWERYWREEPPLHGLTFVFEPDPERRLALLSAGTVDVALRLSETVNERGCDGCRLMWRPAPGARVLGLRVDRPPFSDPRVRRAIHLAVDRATVTHELMGDRALPLGQLLPAGIFGHAPDLLPLPRNLARAQALLRAAAGSAPIAVTLDHGRGRQREAQALAAQLGEAGLAVTLRPREVPDLLRSLDQGDARMVLLSYIYSTGDAVEVFENVLHSRSAAGYGAENGFGYRNAAVDALIEEGGQAADMNGRLEKYQRAMRQVMDDLPVVPLWEVPWVYGVRNDIAWTPPAHGWFDARDVRRR